MLGTRVSHPRLTTFFPSKLPSHACRLSIAFAFTDIVHSIHPIFGGVQPEESAEWTWTFWEDNNKAFWKSDNEKNIIAELGWPSDGGGACPPTSPNCANPAEASIKGINDLLDGWVCDAIKNGTQYWWFSAFDEPWKAQFDDDERKFESKWGLMDVNRNLKDGVTIPDCDGKEVPSLSKRSLST